MGRFWWPLLLVWLGLFGDGDGDEGLDDRRGGHERFFFFYTVPVLYIHTSLVKKKIRQDLAKDFPHGTWCTSRMQLEPIPLSKPLVQ